MMMRMLAEGGMPVLIDRIRESDTDNPQGYFEYEPVKKLKQHSDWMPLAEGNAVKVIAQLLVYLPPGHTYKTIFMERNMEEIVVSQETMLRNLGRSGAGVSSVQLASAFERQLSQIKLWLTHQRGIETLYIGYRDVIEQPMEHAISVNRFLGGWLDIDKMAASVDNRLYRNRR